MLSILLVLLLAVVTKSERKAYAANDLTVDLSYDCIGNELWLR